MSDYEDIESDKSNENDNDIVEKKYVSQKQTKNAKQRKPYIWTDARKAAFEKMIEIKQLKDSNKKMKKKQDNEIKKEILKTSRKQLKEKVKKLNVDELKNKVDIENEVIEETAKKVITKTRKPKPQIIEDTDTDESSYESDDSERLLIKNIDNNNTHVIIKKVKRKEKIISPIKHQEPIIHYEEIPKAKPKDKTKNGN